MTKGKYIVLEGPEGVGKTTQIQELARRLRTAGLPVRTLREPDSQSDLTARALRHLTQDPHYPMNTNTEVLLYNAARSQSLQIIKRSVEQGVICIVDRNYLTTLAIQYYGRGDVPDYETINRIIGFAVNGVEPDLCVVLDAPVSILRDRARNRGQGERFDNLDEAFLERVRAGYLWEAKQRNLPVVFANEDEQVVADRIWKLVAETLAVRGDSQASGEPESVAKIIEKRKVTPANVEPPMPFSEAAALPPDDKQQSRPSFITPKNLDKKIASVYRQQLQDMLKQQSDLVRKLGTADKTDRISRLTLPVAAYAAGPDQVLGLALGSAKENALIALVQKHLHETHDKANNDQVELVDFWPRSELNITCDIIYPYSNLPMRELANQVGSWPYEQKAGLLTTHIADSNAAALHGAGYNISFIGTVLDFIELKRSGISAEHQFLTPRYGYDVPAEIDQASLADDFEKLFDASLSLYSTLQEAGFEAEAQYSVLLGHRTRIKITISPAELVRLQDANSLPKNTLAKFAEAISEVHPLIGASLIRTTETAKR